MHVVPFAGSLSRRRQDASLHAEGLLLVHVVRHGRLTGVASLPVTDARSPPGATTSTVDRPMPLYEGTVSTAVNVHSPALFTEAAVGAVAPAPTPRSSHARTLP